MKMKYVRMLFLLVVISAVSVSAGTVAHWNFNEGDPNLAFSEAGGAVDQSGNGYTMYGYDDYWGAYYSYEGETPSGTGFSARMKDHHQDAYTTDSTINSWSPTTWTIETSVKLNEVESWKTFIGRDGSQAGGDFSDFYFQKNADNGGFRVDFTTVSGERYQIDTDFEAEAGKWYGLAATSDGSTASLYANDGSGYRLMGSVDISDSNNPALADAGGNNWTFGRGWYGPIGFVDHIDGYMDNVRFSDEVLDPSEFVAIPEPATIALIGFGSLALIRRKRS